MTEEFRIVGGHVALDLVNTVAPRFFEPNQVDLFRAPADLLAWARRVDLLAPAEADAVEVSWDGDQALRAVIDIREALYRVLKAVHDGATSPDTAADLDGLALRWSAASARTALTLAIGDGPPVMAVVGTAPTMLIPDRLVVAGVDLLRTLEPRHLGECPATEGGCGWLFLDRSRNGSRRWCTMEDCGAHAKARRLTARRRAQRETS